MMTLDEAITKALDEATKQLKIEELESELNEWKRWCKEKEQALDDLAKAFSQQQDRIKQLEDARTVAAANSLANMLAYEDAVAKIKRLEEAGDVCLDMSFRGMHVMAERNWRKAKEAKP